jgi:cytochrome c biogenesis protein ResB
LVALFVAITLGQLTRFQGMVGIPVGGSRADVAASYGDVEKGPLFPGYTAFELSVPRMEKRVVVGNIDRGASPEVALVSAGRELKRQLVYPNHPLRYGPILIHRSEFGYSIPVSLTSSSTSAAQSVDILIDTDLASPTGTRPGGLSLTGPDGISVDVTLTLAPRRTADGGVVLTPAKQMTLGVRESRTSAAETITVPGTLALPGGGGSLTFGPVVNYSRLVVVRDWSVYWIYGFLGLAMMGVALAILVPYRSAWVLRVETADGTALHVVTSHMKRDPNFVTSVESALRASSGLPEEEHS